MTALHGALAPEGGVKLAHVAAVLNGGTPRADDVNWNGDLPFVTPPDLRGLDGDSIVETSRSLTELGASSGSTVAVSGLAVSCRAPIGYVGRLSRRSAFNQGCKAVVPSPAVDEKYLAYVLVAARPILEALGRGTTFMEISASDLGSLLVPATGGEDQRRIADYLDRETATIDALIEKQRQLIAVLTQRRRTVVEESLVKHELREFPLRRLMTGTVGIVVTPAKWYGEDGPLAVRGLNIREGVFDMNDVVRMSREGDALHPKSRLRAGDVVIVRTGDAGRAAVVPPNLEGTQAIDVLIVRCGPTLEPQFLVDLLSSRVLDDAISTSTSGTIQGHLNVGALKALSIPLPSAAEQRELSAFWAQETEKIDALIAKAERFIELAQERRAALITAAVTGQIEIPTED